MPPAIFISVDLPAPFSPISAWISPGAIAKSTPLSTVTLPNDLRMPRMASRGARALVLIGNRCPPCRFRKGSLAGAPARCGRSSNPDIIINRQGGQGLGPAAQA